jgi:pilus assembly protein CpaF
VPDPESPFGLDDLFDPPAPAQAQLSDNLPIPDTSAERGPSLVALVTQATTLPGESWPEPSDFTGPQEAVSAALTPIVPGDHVMNKMAAIADRADRAERLWPTVDSILTVISKESALQGLVGSFELTRDHRIDADQRKRLQERTAPLLMTHRANIPNPRDTSLVFDMIYDELLGISVLGPFWRDDDVTEIMANGFDDIRIEVAGRILRTPMQFRNPTHIDRVARELARKVSDRSLARNNPLLTAELPGARIAFAYLPIVRGGVAISLRKFMPLMGMSTLLKLGSLSNDMANFLAETVAARGTTLISGGTGTGKTTLINALSEFIPASERVVTIEDAFELSLANDHVVSLQTHEKASADDETVIGQAELLIWALRARPDRIIVGEIREGDGALVMLQAATTGHEGTMTTIHANSAEAALNERFVDLVREASTRPDDVAKRSVAMALDLVIQITRRRGRRYVSEISVVDPSCIHDGRIIPEKVFVGEIDAQGVPQFSKVGDVRPDTDLGKKINEYREEQAEMARQRAQGSTQ